MSDRILEIFEEAERAQSIAELNAIDDSALTDFFVMHIFEWFEVDAKDNEEARQQVEDCAAQISQSLLMRLNDLST